MSNARSPREVCSTTIGISGLMVLALFRLPGSIPPGKCKAAPPPSRVYQPLFVARDGAGRWPDIRCALRPGRPELAAGRRTLRRDRDRRRNETLQGLLGGHVVAELFEPAGSTHLRQQLLGVRDASVLVGLDAALERGEQLLLCRLDRLGRNDRRDHGLGAQRALRARLRGGEHLLLARAADLQVGLLADAAVRERMQPAFPGLLRAR